MIILHFTMFFSYFIYAYIYLGNMDASLQLSTTDLTVHALHPLQHPLFWQYYLPYSLDAPSILTLLPTPPPYNLFTYMSVHCITIATNTH